ncbi:hypothetical protein DQ244_13225 [Blastococcus sp. TBT05-19]|uniref:hypothetical protein n=1 Tax=Blastococcus sp. TBT05-19 TaxID=2250581 RepID=UPI000DE9D6AC|nr:hypothetical protein [Blastococcus sp. TBT05-19]RBY90399.1 hypothetical protein DQ244_13225 [Blastococcus sp. TBT05-19]
MEHLVPREQTDWLVQLLVEAGLGPAEIRVLVTRLCFEVIVADDAGTDARLLEVIADRRPAVRAAWVEVIDRMTSPTGR